MVIGLILVLMIASVAANGLIIKTMRSSYRVEASNRAYLAAEGGIEDALYELSPHFSGYETKSIRKNNYGGNLGWKANWEIKSLSGEDNFEGKIYEKQKLVIGLFNDEGYIDNKTEPLLTDNKISNSSDDENGDTTKITTLNVSDNFKITFSIPNTEEINRLEIDNDGDFTINGVNEDGRNDTDCVTSNNPDCDDDGREDEDSPEDAVIFWRITDGEGNILTPKPGCLIDDGTVQDEGSEICEKDFEIVDDNLSALLDQSSTGITQNNEEVLISDFLGSSYPSGDPRSSNAKLQIEFTAVAPFEYINSISNKEIQIPFIDYKVESGVNNIPLPQFTITSDGWFNDFKQSIVTVITPKSSVPLFDFTIIQQQ